MGSRRVNTKLLCNQCGLAKTLFNQWYQDAHKCPIYNGPFEDQDYLLMCPDPEATKVFNSGIGEI